MPYWSVNVQREKNADDVTVSEVCPCLPFPLLTVPSHYCGITKQEHCTLRTDTDAWLEVSDFSISESKMNLKNDKPCEFLCCPGPFWRPPSVKTGTKSKVAQWRSDSLYDIYNHKVVIKCDFQWQVCNQLSWTVLFKEWHWNQTHTHCDKLHVWM